MTEPEPAPAPPASKKPRGCRVVLIETTPGEMARKTSMLFCSSVATEGSVMPATLAFVFASSLLKAAVGCCRCAPPRSKHATPAAANSADSRAIARICLADIRYMALFLDDCINFKRFLQLRCRAARATLRGRRGLPVCIADLFGESQFYYEAGPRPVQRTDEQRRRNAHKNSSKWIRTAWRKSSAVAFVSRATRTARAVGREDERRWRRLRAAASRARTRPSRRGRA